ncbi:MAG TPA: hypothetical protein VKB51_18360 [bacterium]|nr:hypothetical protein [bacterium]
MIQRIGLAVLVAVSLASVAAAAAAPPPDVSTQVRQLMQRSGMREQILGFKQWLGGATDALRNDQQLPPGDREVAARVLEQVFDPDGLVQRVEANLAAHWDADKAAAVNRFLDSPLGMAMTKMELASGAAGADEALKAWQTDSLRTPPTPERKALVAELDRTINGVEYTVNTWEILASTTTLAVAATQTHGADLSPQQLLDVHKQVRERLETAIKPQWTVNILFTYRDATDEQLRDYIAFYKSPVGQWYNNLTGSALLAALQERSDTAIREMRRQMTKS